MATMFTGNQIIADIEFDAVTSEAHSMEATATQYAVDGNAMVSDHVTVLPDSLEIRGGLGVDGIGVEVGAGGQVDLRVVDVEKRHGIAFGELGGLGRIHGVVGGSGDLGDDVGAGPQGFIGMDAHGGTSFSCLTNSMYEPTIL